MAAREGIRDKILRVSVRFGKGMHSTGELRAVRPQNHLVFGSASDLLPFGHRGPMNYIGGESTERLLHRGRGIRRHRAE